LRTAIAHASALGGDWVMQDLVPGPTYLYGGLFHQGNPLRVYAGEKLEQYPQRTGPAIRLRSADHAALFEIGARVFRELAWTGFASADFIRRPDGTFVLLEVNPRLWGSIAGAAAAGVDLFTPFAELLAGRVPAPDLTCAANRECRIFPRYLLSPSYRGVSGLFHAIRDWLGPQGASWRDPRLVVHNLFRLYGARRGLREL
jgi:predicted ATP-grasp superfamily ATP-dependent carboligase